MDISPGYICIVLKEESRDKCQSEVTKLHHRLKLENHKLNLFNKYWIEVKDKLIADLKDVLPLLLKGIEGTEKNRNDWLEVVKNTKHKYAKLFEEKLSPQLAWLNAIRAELPKDGIF